uniref:Uncharacterized protein n=1 Tax=viral metagenome TaxID=1070528 RepID=A0A6H1ZBU3_9ZZZZ
MKKILAVFIGIGLVLGYVLAIDSMAKNITVITEKTYNAWKDSPYLIKFIFPAISKEATTTWATKPSQNAIEAEAKRLFDMIKIVDDGTGFAEPAKEITIEK